MLAFECISKKELAEYSDKTPPTDPSLNVANLGPRKAADLQTAQDLRYETDLLCATRC